MKTKKLDEQLTGLEEDVRRIEHSLRSDDEVLNGNVSDEKLEEIAEYADEMFEDTEKSDFEQIATHLRNMKIDD
jgi:hypothetical protein